MSRGYPGCQAGVIVVGANEATGSVPRRGLARAGCHIGPTAATCPQ